MSEIPRLPDQEVGTPKKLIVGHWFFWDVCKFWKFLPLR